MTDGWAVSFVPRKKQYAPMMMSMTASHLAACAVTGAIPEYFPVSTMADDLEHAKRLAAMMNGGKS